MEATELLALAVILTLVMQSQIKLNRQGQKSWSNLQRHENDEVGDELVDPAEVKLFPGQRLLGDEAVREAVEEAVVER